MAGRFESASPFVPEPFPLARLCTLCECKYYISLLHCLQPALVEEGESIVEIVWSRTEVGMYKRTRKQRACVKKLLECQTEFSILLCLACELLNTRKLMRLPFQWVFGGKESARARASHLCVYTSMGMRRPCALEGRIADCSVKSTQRGRMLRCGGFSQRETATARFEKATASPLASTKTRRT